MCFTNVHFLYNFQRLWVIIIIQKQFRVDDNIHYVLIMFCVWIHISRIMLKFTVNGKGIRANIWKTFSKTFSLFDDIIIRQKVASHTKSWSSLNFCLCIFILPWMEFPWFIASYPIIVQYSCCIWINIATFLFPFDLERGSWISSLIVWMFIGVEGSVTENSAY